MVDYINEKILKTEKSRELSTDDFLTLYKGSQEFRDSGLLKECSIFIHLVLSLSDINITLEKKRSIMGIVAELKKHGLSSPNDREPDATKFISSDAVL